MKLFLLLHKLFDFFIFTSLFIAVCAALMAYQTLFLFRLPVSNILMLFVFCGTIASYNFHWFLTPPHTENQSKKTLWNINYKNVHLALAIAGLAGAAVGGFLLIENWFWLSITALFTFLYTAPKIPHPLFIRLKKIAIAKTIYLAFAWTMVTVILPLFIHSEKVETNQILFIINRFFFIYAICIIFDRRDAKQDRKAGIKSMITYLDEKGIDILFWGSIAIFIITSILMLEWFSPLIINIILFPGILLSLLYYPLKKNFSDYLYYFLLDGLMMLSAPLLILTKFVR